MNYFLKYNKNLLTFILIILISIPIFGVNFFLSFLGNIILLMLLLPLFLLLLVFVGLNFYKSKIKKCSSCGSISFGLSENCMNCGADLGDILKGEKLDTKPCESTIEIKAEEVN